MTNKETQIEIPSLIDLINFNNKVGGCMRYWFNKIVKLSEIKLHVKAYPYKHLDNNCVASKRLYLFDSIRISNIKGQLILEHNLPEVIELDDNYSIKLSDIFHDDIIVEGLDISLRKNNRPFEITELYFQYIETDEEPPSVPFYKIFERVYNILDDNLGQEYRLILKENHNMTTKLPEFKYQRITKENDIYYISKYNYENDIEWIMLDNKEQIDKNMKKLEEYIGHDVLVKIKSTSNVLFLSEIKYFK